MKKILFLVALFLISLCGCDQQSEQPAAPTAPAVLDLTDSVFTVSEFHAAADEFPDTDIIWSVPLSSGPMPSNSSALSLSGLDEFDLDLIPYFPNLKSLDLTNCSNYALVSRLISEFPSLSVTYAVQLGTDTYPGDYDGSISISDPDIEQLETVLPCLPRVRQIFLYGSLPDSEDLIALKNAFPNITFVWDFDFLGVPVNSLTEEVDLSGKKLQDTTQLESLLDCFYQLKTVDLSDCGLNNKVMEALNRNHPDTEFVWEVQIGWRMVRTDSIYFVPSKYGVTSFHPSHFANLKYLTNLQLLDLGHFLTPDISFLAYMPDMKYLSLNSGIFQDLSPLAYCQDLEYLELFLSKGTDLWPLVNCPNLKNLNIPYMPYCDPRPLHQMVWLDRLWLAKAQYTDLQKQELREALPYTVILYVSHSSTDKGWRNSPGYYATRDIADMSYMIK